MKDQTAENISKIAENQGSYGRLRFVSRTKKVFVCRECKKDLEIGSKCFCQSDYTQDAFFPEQTRLCLDCGKLQMDNGIEIKNKELYDKILLKGGEENGRR